MIYLDTSVLVALLTPEETSERVAAWITAREPGTLHVSGWVATEFGAAVTRKVRTGRLTRGECDRARREYESVVSGAFTVLAIEPGDFHSAAQLVADPEAGIRAGDGLHLAVALAHGMSLATLDKRFVAGAAKLGYQLEELA